MLYSKETIVVKNTEQEVYLYLKNVRNHSFRISANKISMTLPDRYKNPDTIEKYKRELLDMVIKKLEDQPKWLVRKSLLTQKYITILNRPFRIEKLTSEQKLIIDFNSGIVFWDESQAEQLKPKLVKALTKKYEIEIDHRVRYWNQMTTQRTIRTVRLKNNLTSWGLCSSHGDITISIHTLFAPLWVIDYVIIHELCHLIHHDHSAAFWNLVERFYPKYKVAKKYLKDKGMELAY